MAEGTVRLQSLCEKDQALISSKMFSSVDFSARYLRGLRPNIFFYKHSGDHCQSNVCIAA